MPLLDVLVVLLILAWLTGTFIMPVGGGIHLLLLLVLVLFLIRWMPRQPPL